MERFSCNGGMRRSKQKARKAAGRSRRQFFQLNAGHLRAVVVRARAFSQPQRQILSSFVQALQHIICLSPAGAAARRGFNHLQSGSRPRRAATRLSCFSVSEPRRGHDPSSSNSTDVSGALRYRARLVTPFDLQQVPPRAAQSGARRSGAAPDVSAISVRPAAAVGLPFLAGLSVRRW